VRTHWLDWEAAWEQALYGADGFVHTGGAPAQHFRTSVHVGTVLAEALLELLDRIDHALSRPSALDLVDLGAGAGELLATMVELAPTPMRGRLHPLAVDVRAAPAGWTLPWTAQVPRAVTGLIVAHEWLDALPCPVVQHDGQRLRRVQVAPDGSERLGPSVADTDAEWLRRWWPLAPGDRAEVGLGREHAWRSVLARLTAGVALAVDYGHVAGERPSAGTLSGYRDGRQVRPIPDGRCDLTAHVALDALAAVAPGRRPNQAEALRALGVASPWTGFWLERAVRAGQVAELTDPNAFGGFGWVLHPAQLTHPF